MGAPSSTLGAISPGVSMNLSDEAAYISAINAGNTAGRAVVGPAPMSAIMSPPRSDFQHEDLLVAKYQMMLQDPAMVPGVVPRTPTYAESLGARFAPQAVVTAATLPEASATMSSARPIPSAVNRSSPAFYAGIASAG
jgi:hypothetical protein